MSPSNIRPSVEVQVGRRTTLARYMPLLAVLLPVCAQNGERQKQDAEMQEIEAMEEPDVPAEIWAPALPDDLHPWLGQTCKTSNIAATGAVKVRARLGGRGRLVVKGDERWDETTLDGFRRVLEAALLDAQSGDTAVKWNWREPGLVVEIDAHSDALWRHVGWLAVVCEEQRFRLLRLRVQGRQIDVRLPLQSSRTYLPIPEGQRVAIDILAAKEVTAKWGNTTIQKPTAARFRASGEILHDVGAVRSYVDRAKRAAVVSGNTEPLVGMLNIDGAVDVEHVMRILEAFLASDIKRFGSAFIDGVTPTEADRRIHPLPYPAK